MVKIFIDPGHGGNDPGAVANGLKEKDLNLKIAKKIANLLSGVATVKLSRSTDTFLKLEERARLANNWGADLFVSIHINAGGGTGFESFVYNRLSSNSKAKTIQKVIHDEIMKQIPDVVNRGMKQANFAVLRLTKMPAILTENLFIDTKADANKLKSDAYLDKIAKGHALGIAKALGLNLNEKDTAVPSKESSKTSTKTSKKTGSPKINLKVDGQWGKETTKALQIALNTIQDGIISNQLKNAVTLALYNCVTWGKGGSLVVKELQKMLGVKVDGYLGPETIRALQRYLGTPVDGKISRPRSKVVEAMQRRLNEGTFVK